MDNISFSCQSGEILHGFQWLVDKPKANIMLITGLNEYALRYTRFVQLLNNNNYNVFCLDYFGQGASAISVKDLGKEPKYGFSKFVDALYLFQRVIMTLNSLPIYYIGHSMGSFIAQELIQRYPNCTKKVVLSGTAGPQSIVLPGYLFLKLTVHKGNWDKVCKISATAGYEKGVKDRKLDCDWLSYNDENNLKYSKDPYSQYQRSNGAQLNLLTGLKNLHKKKRMKQINPETDILMISGKDDPVSNYTKTTDKLFKLYGKCGHAKITYKVYGHMRHEILNEVNHAIVDQDILDFLAK